MIWQDNEWVHVWYYDVWKVEMNVENDEYGGVKVDCFYAFNTFEVFVPFVVGCTWLW